MFGRETHDTTKGLKGDVCTTLEPSWNKNGLDSVKIVEVGVYKIEQRINIVLRLFYDFLFSAHS